jgi:hypothetical protein
MIYGLFSKLGPRPLRACSHFLMTLGSRPPPKLSVGACSAAAGVPVQELGPAMEPGLYSITTKGFDGVEWPPGGVFFLRNGVLLGGCSFMYYVGSYSTEDGIFKGECVLNPHTRPPPGHLYFNAKDIGAGFTGTYEADQAELTATVLVGTSSLTLQLTLRKLADIEKLRDSSTSRRRALPSPTE